MFILNYVVWYVLLTWGITLVTIFGGAIVCVWMIAMTSDRNESLEDYTERATSIANEALDRIIVGSIEDQGNDSYLASWAKLLLMAPIYWPRTIRGATAYVKSIYKLIHEQS